MRNWESLDFRFLHRPLLERGVICEIPSWMRAQVSVLAKLKHGDSVMIQTQLHCLYILGFFLVNTEKAVLQSESVKASTCLKSKLAAKVLQGVL